MLTASSLNANKLLNDNISAKLQQKLKNSLLEKTNYNSYGRFLSRVVCELWIFKILIWFKSLLNPLWKYKFPGKHVHWSNVWIKQPEFWSGHDKHFFVAISKGAVFARLRITDLDNIKASDPRKWTGVSCTSSLCPLSANFRNALLLNMLFLWVNNKWLERGIQSLEKNFYDSSETLNNSWFKNGKQVWLHGKKKNR